LVRELAAPFYLIEKFQDGFAGRLENLDGG